MWTIISFCLGLAICPELLDVAIPLEKHLDERSCLGWGDDGEVFCLEGKYALKVYAPGSSIYAEREFSNHQMLTSHYFATVYKIFEKSWKKQRCLCLLREYIDGESLMRSQFCSAHELGHFLVDIAKMWEQLLNYGLFWEDFHCGNLMVTENKTLKVIDLSRCRPLDEAQKIQLRQWAAKLQNIARLAIEVTLVSPQDRACILKAFKQLRIEKPEVYVGVGVMDVMQKFLSEFSALGSSVSNDQKELDICAS